MTSVVNRVVVLDGGIDCTLIYDNKMSQGNEAEKLEILVSDLNGSVYSVADSGYSGASDLTRKWVLKSGARPCDSNDNATAFLRKNAAYIMTVKPSVQEQEALRIAYLRLMILKMGIIDGNESTNEHHVAYTDVYILSDTEWAAIPNGDFNVKAWIEDATWREEVKCKLTDMICLVAYMFHVRGHHHLPDMEDRYIAIWAKCYKNAGTIGVSWANVAHLVSHAIFPDILDAYYKDCVAKGTCAGALCKRFDSAAAGTAVISAMMAGYRDIGLVIPQIRDLVKESVTHLLKCHEVIRADRHAGSINRALYGASAMIIDEAKLAPLAAIIVAMYGQIRGQSSLLNSKALGRVSSVMPVTGQYITILLKSMVSEQSLIQATKAIESGSYMDTREKPIKKEAETEQETDGDETSV